MFEERILIRGGGDLGSGVALRLWRAGFRVAILEMPMPIAVRRTVAFSEAVYDGGARVEEADARLVKLNELGEAMDGAIVPVVVDPHLESVEFVRPFAVIDAILAKRNTGIRIGTAPLVVALGPGFEAGVDCDAVVETNRGPDLGRVIWTGRAEIDTGEPGVVGGKSSGRVLRSPTDGLLENIAAIGDIVEEGQVVATVSGEPIRAGFRSLLRGLARDGLVASKGMKIGDIDPRLDPRLCWRVSDKSLAVAGGVLEAVLMGVRGKDR